MKICIVIQSEAFRTSAGMRIRYERFAQCLGPDHDVRLEALTCGEVSASKSLDHDVYVFCKTFDLSALLLARRLRGAGKTVGLDVFDDYFSQSADPRLQKYRDWLRDMAPVTDFAICSTPAMVDVLRAYLPHIRITAVDDPILGFDPQLVGTLADRKVAKACESRSVNVVWFGIGDNPYFPVGLTDLANCDADLARMTRLGWNVNLTVVTNRRPFEGAGGEVLRALSTPLELVEWTEEAERTALGQAAVALLPVNGQSFSRAKSLNRAITALSHGCQVLSLGYPLYARLDGLIYRSSEELLADLEAGTCRVSSASVPTLSARIAEVASPAEAAATFVGEARRAKARTAARRGDAPLLCLFHGRKTAIGLHKTVSTLGGLSISTIFTQAGWNFPVRFDLADGAVVMRATQAVIKRFSLPVRDPTRTVRIADFDFAELDLEALGITPLALCSVPTLPIHDAALSESVLQFAEKSCCAAFGRVDVLFSDSSPLTRRPRSASLASVGAGEVEENATRDDVRETDFSWSEKVVRPGNLLQRLASRIPGRSGSAGLSDAAAQIEDCALFNAEWYLRTNSDVASKNLDPVQHYLEFGWLEGRDPGPGFSTKLYLKDNADVAQQDMNPLLHYIRYGQYEGRKVRPAIVRELHST